MLESGLMKPMKVRWFIPYLTLLVLPLSVAAAKDDYVPNEVLVEWKARPNQVTKVKVDDVNTAVKILQQDTRVGIVEPNYRRRLFTEPLVPNDPYFGVSQQFEQANDHDMDATAAWSITTGSHDIVVAVIDTGVDLTHPDLEANIWMNPDEVAGNGVDDDSNGFVDDVHGWDFINNDADASPKPVTSVWKRSSVNHGTHVAGIIGAVGNNGVGVTGVNWNVSIMPVRAVSARGLADVETIIKGIRYAVANGADVINLSIGEYYFSELESAAIAEATAQGTIVVAAAGNKSTDLSKQPVYPACYTSVVGVGATNAQGDLAGYSNFGRCLDVMAPGSNIVSTLYRAQPELEFTHDYGFMTGTSMATPMVAGMAGLVKAADPDISVAEFTRLITSTADPLEVKGTGAGHVNLAMALTNLNSTTAAPKAVRIQGYSNDSASSILASTQRSDSDQPYFTWTALNNVSGYYVYFGPDANANPVLAGSFRKEANFKPQQAVVANEEHYYLRVVALSKTGVASEVSQYTYIPDTTIKAPVWDTAKWVTGGLEISWNAPVDDHATSYTVYRSNRKNGKYIRLAYLVTSEKFVDTTVKAGDNYFYRLTATDDFGNVSKMSNILVVEL